MVLSFESVDGILQNAIIQMKSTDQYFAVILLVVLTFESVDGIYKMRSFK